MKELLCFPHRLMESGGPGGVATFIIPVFYLLDIEGCKGKELFDVTLENNVFVTEGFLASANEGRATLKEVRDAVRTVKAFTSIEYTACATNGLRLEDIQMPEKLVDRIVDAVVEVKGKIGKRRVRCAGVGLILQRGMLCPNYIYNWAAVILCPFTPHRQQIGSKSAGQIQR